MSKRLRGFLAVIATALMLAGSGLHFSGASATGGTTPIEAKALTDHSCDSSEWHFVITQVDSEQNAPASIMVNWANGGSESVPLDKFTGGVAHYATTSNLDSTVTSATTSIYEGWDGQFNLSHGPCGDGEEPPPTSVTPDKPSATQPNCDNPNMTVTPGSQPGVVWTPSGATVLEPGESVTYVATPAAKHAFPPNSQTSWTFTNTFDPSKECEEEPPPVTSVTPDKPSATQPNCDNPNMTVTPSNEEGVVWTPKDATVLKPGESVTYTASPAKDFTFPKDAQTSWTFTNTFDPSKECEEEPPPPDSCPPLTGSVKTTLPDGSVVNGNIYTDKSDVYVYGEQLGDVETVYIRVTDPSGSTVLSDVKQVSVTDGTFGPVQLPAFADTPNNGDEYKVWVSSTTDFEQNCTKFDNFKVKGDDEEPPPPTSVTPDKPSATQPNCQQPNMTVTPGSQPGVVWNPSGSTVLEPGESVTYTATPAKDYEFPKGAQTEWTFTNTFDPEVCEEEPTPVSPTEPTSSDVCEPATGPTNDRINGLSDANFTYQVDGVDATTSSFVATGTSHTVTAVPNEGVVVKQGAKLSWPFTFTKVKCVTTTETPSPTPTPTVSTPTPTTPTETPTTPNENPTPTTPTETPTPEIGTPTSTSVPTPTSTPTFVPPSTGGGDWPPASYGSGDVSFVSLLAKLMMLGGMALLLFVVFAPRRRKMTI